MKSAEHSFQEFVDAVHTAEDQVAFERVARRITERLGFRWFAYLRLSDETPTLMSSYPKSWTDRYFNLGHQQIDPVIRRARIESGLFSWGGDPPRATGTREQRIFFDEAMTFGIKSGVTVPIKGGFGQIAAFTMSTDEAHRPIDLLVNDCGDILQLVGLYFHAHAMAKLQNVASSSETESILSQRERQCLAWIARGKTVVDTSVLVGIAPRTVVYHLENARQKFSASSIAQCVAEAVRRDLLP